MKIQNLGCGGQPGVNPPPETLDTTRTVTPRPGQLGIIISSAGLLSAFLEGGDLLVAAGLMLVFEVDEFRHVIGLDGKYERMDHLKTKVIKPALRDVNAHTDLAGQAFLHRGKRPCG